MTKKAKHTNTIEKYRTDALVVRTYASSRKVVPPSDSTVKSIPSDRSLKNLIFLLNNCDVPMVTMVTITLGDKVSALMKIKEHKQLLKAGLTRLMRAGATQYVWVREFQDNGTPHWHIFTDWKVRNGLDVERSEKWSKWCTNYCRKKLGFWPELEEQLYYMEFGNKDDLIGCVHVESLRKAAAGCYAGKEGAKRFQKIAPPRWQKSGSWWDKGGPIKCTPVERVQVDSKTLAQAEVMIQGKKLKVPFRLQFGRGLRKETKAEQVVNRWSEFDQFDDTI